MGILEMNGQYTILLDKGPRGSLSGLCLREAQGSQTSGHL